MLFKSDNILDKSRDSYSIRNRFGIRKLTVGAVSVLLGTTLWIGGKNADIVHADDVNNTDDGNGSVEQQSDQQAITETPSKVVVSSNSNTENTAPENKVETSVQSSTDDRPVASAISDKDSQTEATETQVQSENQTQQVASDNTKPVASNKNQENTNAAGSQTENTQGNASKESLVEKKVTTDTSTKKSNDDKPTYNIPESSENITANSNVSKIHNVEDLKTYSNDKLDNEVKKLKQCYGEDKINTLINDGWLAQIVAHDPDYIEYYKQDDPHGIYKRAKEISQEAGALDLDRFVYDTYNRVVNPDHNSGTTGGGGTPIGAYYNYAKLEIIDDTTGKVLNAYETINSSDSPLSFNQDLHQSVYDYLHDTLGITDKKDKDGNTIYAGDNILWHDKDDVLDQVAQYQKEGYKLVSSDYHPFFSDKIAENQDLSNEYIAVVYYGDKKDADELRQKVKDHTFTQNDAFDAGCQIYPIPYVTNDPDPTAYSVKNFEKRNLTHIIDLRLSSFNSKTNIYERNYNLSGLLGARYFQIHLTHATAPKNITKNVTRTIDYQYEDGTSVPGLNEVTQKVTFTGTGTTDLVTGKLIDPDNVKAQDVSITWTSDPTNAEYEKVSAIPTDEYSIVRISENNTVANVDSTTGEVASEVVTTESKDSKIVITLAKKQHKAALVFHDDTSNVNLTSSIPSQGTTDDEISFTDADKILAGYVDGENAKYKFVSTTEDDQKDSLTSNRADALAEFGKYDKKAKNFVIHLVHATKHVDKDHPGHGYKSEDLEKTVTTTVHYVDDKGNTIVDDAGHTLVEDVNNSQIFDGEGDYDAVTGEWVTVDKDGNITGKSDGIKWTPENKNFNEISTKSIPGYDYISGHGSIDSNLEVDFTNGSVGAQTMTPTTANSDITFVYTKHVDAITGSVTYIDDTNDGSTLEQSDFGGNVGDKINYTTNDRINFWENKGYELVGTNPFKDGEQTYDKDVKNNTFEIHFVHTTTHVDKDHPSHGYTSDDLQKTVTTKVKYVDENGKQLADPVNESVTFTASGDIDNVTGQLVTVKDGKITGKASGLTWNKTEKNWDAIPAQTIQGYDLYSISGTKDNDFIIDSKTGAISAQKVTPKSVNTDITIVYTPHKDVPKPANGTLKYIDDSENGQEIASATFGGQVGSNITYDTSSVLKVLGDRGYKVVSNNYDNGTKQYNADPSKNNFEIHLVHTTKHVDHNNPGHGYNSTDLEKTVTTTVHYVDNQGNTITDDVKNSQTFDGEGDYDAVTGEWVTVDKDGNITGKSDGIKWTPENKNFNEIGTKAIPGYDYISGHGLVDPELNVNFTNGSVGAQEMTPMSINSDITFVYTKHVDVPVTTTGKLTYIDDTTGNNLSWINFFGTAGNHIDYNALDQIKNYEDQGYDLVSDNYDQNGQTPIFDEDASKNVFEIHLKHATTPIDHNNPGKPGNKVPKDPTKPNEPDHKYPDNYVPQTLTKTITRDVTYVMADGSKAPDPVHQTVTFNGNGILDLVTGGLVTVDKDGKITPNGQITWTAENGDSFAATDPVAKNGYKVVSTVGDVNKKVDQATGAVASDKVTQDSDNQSITIVLNKGNEKPDISQQTRQEIVHYVDENGKSIIPDTVNDNHTFTKVNGNWTENNYQYKGGNVPVIPGYVATIKTFEGASGTPDKDAEVTITYKKIGTIIPVDKDGNEIPGQQHPQFKNDPNDPTKVIDGQKPSVPGYKPETGKAGDPVHPDTDLSKDVKVPYIKDKTPEPQPTAPQPTLPSSDPSSTPTTNPAPSNPTEPIEPSTPEPNIPDTPEPDIPETPKHHKKTPTSKRTSENFAPHAQSWDNVAPHSQNNTMPNGESVSDQGQIIDSEGNVIGYIDKNGNAHYYALPQTGENDNEDVAALIAGGVAVSMSLLGLAGVKKRRQN